MAELIAIRRMRADDLPAADRLREQAGWNQTLGDWQRVLSWEPEGCFVAEHQGAVFGTVTATRYGSRLAWIGMMLVDQAMRSRGIGRQLLSHALEWLERDGGIACVGLDATPQGKLLYDTMGFVDAYTLQRRQGDAPALEPSPQVEVLQSADIDVLRELDSQALGADRMRILRDLHMAHPDGCYVVRANGHVVGYAFTRPGARRWYVGPVVARDADSATALLHTAIAPLAGSSIVVDTVDENAAATRLAEELGLTPVRPFIRMWRGQPLPPADTSTVCFGIAGPELG